MQLRITYDGKPAIFTVTQTNMRYEIASPKIARIYEQGSFRNPAPPLVLDGSRLRWGTKEFEVSPKEQRSSLESFVALYELLRDGKEPRTVSAIPSVAQSSTAADRAYRIADNVQALAWLLLLLGLVAGGLAAFSTGESCDVGSFATVCDSTHPYVGLGIGIAVASVFQMAVVIMIAAYIQARVAADAGLGGTPSLSPTSTTRPFPTPNQ